MGELADRFKDVRRRKEEAETEKWKRITALDAKAERLRNELFEALDGEVGFLENLGFSLRRTSEWIFLDHDEKAKVVKVSFDYDWLCLVAESTNREKPFRGTALDEYMSWIAEVIEDLDKELNGKGI